MNGKGGRYLAQRLGLKIAGIVGILLEAKNRQLLGSVRSYLDALRHNAGFYLKDSLYRTALQLAGEAIE